MDLTDIVFKQVIAERLKQDRKWGEQNHEDGLWLAILSEEFGEVAKEANETHFRNKNNTELKQELVQVMAVCAAWLECLKRKELRNAKNKEDTSLGIGCY